MPSIYCEIFSVVEDISKQLDELYKINPRVYIIFSQKNTKIEGSCQPEYRISRMYLEIIIPNNYTTFGKKRKVEVISTVIHEYGHYLAEIKLTGKERMRLGQEYGQNNFVRKCVEQSNWTTTKRLAQQLGLWNKYFYNVCKEYYYTSNLTYTIKTK